MAPVWLRGAALLLTLVLSVLVLVLAVQAREQFRANRVTGLAIGIARFLLFLPVMLLTIAHAEEGLAVREAVARPEMAPFAARMFYASLVGAVTANVIMIVWHMAVYHAAAAQWGAVRPDALPLLQRRGTVPWGAVGGAAAFGALAGVAAVAAVGLRGLESAPAIVRMVLLTPGVVRATVPLRLAVLAPAVVGAALTEELAFRGVLLGWLLRRLRGRAGAALAVALASLLWTCAYLPATGGAPFKLAYVFLVGVLLCVFARRWCVEAAVASHIALNVAALLAGTLVG
jgi:membrane protease YdiL (CAAX protease family)